MSHPITFDASCQTTNEEWKNIIARQFEASRSFEIHCWQDELEAIEMALRYGSIKPSDWLGGVVIEGDATPEFCGFLLSLPKPTDTEIYNKMTPFFNIFLDNGFCSEHYGTELISR